MTSFSDQLSTVRKTQLEAQLDAFRTLTTHALDSAGQLFALNMKASRQSVEQAAGTVKHLFEARDPRDLFAVGSAAQGQWQNLFAYSRELFSIATGGPNLRWYNTPQALSAPLALVPAPTATMPVSPANAAEQASIAFAGATTVSSEIASAALDSGAALAESVIAPAQAPAASAPVQEVTELATETAGEPQAPVQADAQAVAKAEAEAAAETALEDALAVDTPPAEPKPLAKALKEAAPPPAAIEHPLASTLALAAAGEVELPEVAPVEHAPPVPQPTARGPRASRKK